MYKTLHKKQGSVTVQLRFARSSVTFCAKRDIKKNCNEDFLWEMLAEHVEDDTFFTWAVEHDKLYYKAFKSYQKILEKDGQPDEKISSEVDAETEENMAVLDEEVEELT